MPAAVLRAQRIWPCALTKLRARLPLSHLQEMLSRIEGTRSAGNGSYPHTEEPASFEMLREYPEPLESRSASNLSVARESERPGSAQQRRAERRNAGHSDARSKAKPVADAISAPNATMSRAEPLDVAIPSEAEARGTEPQPAMEQSKPQSKMSRFMQKATGSSRGEAKPVMAVTAHPAPRTPTSGRSQRERLERFIDIDVENITPARDQSLAGSFVPAKSCAPSLSRVAGGLAFCLGASRRFMRTAPIHAGIAVFGLTMAFYGRPFMGVYAATEAVRNLGFNAVLEEMDNVGKQWSASDEQLRAAGALSPDEIISRQTFALFAALRRPVRVQRFASCLITSWLGILVTMQWEWARSGAVGVGIGNFVSQPVVALLGAPVGSRAFEPEHRQWTPFAIETVMQAVWVGVAFGAPEVAASFYSAIAGGLLCARALLSLMLLAVASETDASCKPGGACAAMAQRVGSVDESLLDEAVGYLLAIAGLVFQLVTDPALVFPASLLLAPLLWVQYLMDWQRTWVDFSDGSYSGCGNGPLYNATDA